MDPRPAVIIERGGLISSAVSWIYSLWIRSHLCKMAAVHWLSRRPFQADILALPIARRWSGKGVGSLPGLFYSKAQDRMARPQGPSSHGPSPLAANREGRRTISSRHQSQRKFLPCQQSRKWTELWSTPSSACNSLLQGSGAWLPTTNMNICSIGEPCRRDQAPTISEWPLKNQGGVKVANT